MSIQTTDLGKVMTTPRGEYNEATQYHELDIVTHQGSSYLVLSDVIGVTPAEGDEHYQVLAKKGDQGIQGPAGPEGPQGPAGAAGHHIGAHRSSDRHQQDRRAGSPERPGTPPHYFRR